MSDNVKIIRPKLEQNSRPSIWSPCSVWESSLIKQTADSITLEVDKIVSGATSGLSEDISNLYIKADGISGSVKHLEDRVANDNLFPLNGWKDDEDEYIEVLDDMKYATTASTIISPSIYLEPGTYIASSYNTDHKQFTSSVDATDATVMDDKDENKYKSIIRSYCKYTIETAGNYQFTMPTNCFYRPKLELGDTITAYANQTVQYSSLISQTSNQISLKVTEEIENNDLVHNASLKETGIDIESGKITLNADNTLINGNLNLNANNDSDALTLNDENNVARATVTSHEIGTLSEQSSDANTQILKSYSVEQGDACEWVLQEKTFAQNTIIKTSLSNVTTYYVGQVGVYDTNGSGRTISSPSSCIISMQFVNTSDSSIVYDIPAQATKQAPDTPAFDLKGGTISHPNILVRLKQNSDDTVTITTAGTYQLKVTVTWSNGSTLCPFSDTSRINVAVNYAVDAETKTLLGADGLYITNGDNKYTFAGSDGLYSVNGQSSNQMSSVGAISSTNSDYLNYGSPTGPSHIAVFNESEVSTKEWTNAQSYANTYYYSAMMNRYQTVHPLSSVDTIIVYNDYDASYYVDSTVTIDLSKLEFEGHVVCIKKLYQGNTSGGSIIDYIGVNLKSSNSATVFVNSSNSRTTTYTCSDLLTRLLYFNTGSMHGWMVI